MRSVYRAQEVLLNCKFCPTYKDKTKHQQIIIFPINTLKITPTKMFRQ